MRTSSELIIRRMPVPFKLCGDNVCPPAWFPQVLSCVEALLETRGARTERNLLSQCYRDSFS
jgi:hypothetical protein